MIFAFTEPKNVSVKIPAIRQPVHKIFIPPKVIQTREPDTKTKRPRKANATAVNRPAAAMWWRPANLSIVKNRISRKRSTNY